MNRLVRHSLAPELPMRLTPWERETSAALCGSEGLLWYRGYFAETGSALGLLALMSDTRTIPDSSKPHIDRVLAAYGCKQIVVVHTVTRVIQPLYGGKVIPICTWLPGVDLLDADSRAEALIIEGQTWYRATADGSLEKLSCPGV